MFSQYAKVNVQHRIQLTLQDFNHVEKRSEKKWGKEARSVAGALYASNKLRKWLRGFFHFNFLRNVTIS